VAEGVTLRGVFHAWFFGKPPEGVVVGWGGGVDCPAIVTLPEIGTVYPYNPRDRWSGWDLEKRAIEIAGPAGGPLSHQLLLLHEVSHAVNPTDEHHGAAWVRTFLDLVERHLPSLSYELTVELRRHGVRIGK
jgi:hypothetical protein